MHTVFSSPCCNQPQPEMNPCPSVMPLSPPSQWWPSQPQPYVQIFRGPAKGAGRGCGKGWGPSATVFLWMVTGTVVSSRRSGLAHPGHGGKAGQLITCEVEAVLSRRQDSQQDESQSQAQPRPLSHVPQAPGVFP